MSSRSSLKRTLAILAGCLAVGTVALTYSAFLLARALAQMGSQFLAGMLESLASIVAWMVAIELGTLSVVWATQGAIPALVRAAIRYSEWCNP